MYRFVYPPRCALRPRRRTPPRLHADLVVMLSQPEGDCPCVVCRYHFSTMGEAIPAADTIPGADAAALATVLCALLYCPADLAAPLADQCRAAIADLPPDSRPITYDGLVDVARYCVEEEPGWSRADQSKLASEHPRLDQLLGKSEQLTSLCDEYEAHFHGLRFLTGDLVRAPELAADELERFLQQVRSDPAVGPGAPAWEAELDRLLEVFWDVAVDRAAELKPGATLSILESFPVENSAEKAEKSIYNTSDSSSEDMPFLSLASFRALTMASPVLEKFFDHDLVRSIRLEEVQRSSTGAAFAWHAAPVLPRGAAPRAVPGSRGPDSKTSATNSGTVSLAATLLHGNSASLDADTPASYSRDITTGTRGKVVGFLGGLLGEEGKTRMDALADQVALRLQTHSVRGPLPSFAPEPRTEPPKSTTWSSAWRRSASAAAGAVSQTAGEGRPAPGLSGRLAGVFRWSSREQPSSSVETGDDVSTQQEGASEVPAFHRTSLRGSDLATEGPEAAVASLRAATEALVQERRTFVIDEVQGSADAEGEDDGEDDVEASMDAFGGDAVEKADSSNRGEIRGSEAKRAHGT